MPSQQPVEGTSTKLLSESPGWNALQTLKSCLSGRLVVFAPDRRPSRRPSRFENDVSFFEDDLGYIFNVNLVAVSLPEKDHSDMDSMALDVLESLNDIVSRDFVKLQEMGDIREFDPREDSSSKACKVTSFAKYKRISAMICCLQTHPEAHFSLVAGPDPTLFTLPSNGHGKVVKGRVKRWRAFLDRLAADAEISQGLQIISLQAIGIPTEELTDKEGDVLERRAGVVIDAMFREFRQLSCATVKTHEVKLRLSGLYTGPPMAFLEMFVSCCAGEKWHEAKCGSFPVEIDKRGKESFCAIIPRATDEAKKLHLYVSQRGIFNVTDMFPELLSTSSKLTSKALKDLFREKVFGHLTLEDFKNGTMSKKVGLKEKAKIVLMLARCLLEFFDEDIELASHSWAPEQIFFVSPSTSDVAPGDLYVSLKPRLSEIKAVDLLEEFRAGNPTLLSFARLMLEIDLGEEIQMDIRPTKKDNERSWVTLCDLVERKLEHGGNVQYLEAVKGCLHLCDNLPESKNRATGSAARKVLRRAIYEKIVRKLEIIVNPQNSKRRRQHSVSEYPQAKKSAITSQLGIDSTSSFQNPATQVEELDPSTLDSFHAGKLINPEDWLEDIKRISRYIAKIKHENFASTKSRPVRIAILDSGCNLEAQYFQDDEGSQREARIVDWKDFVHGSEAKVDIFGHGTFMAMLVIESAPLAELYVARVAENTTQLIGMEGNISRAIRWAGIECNTDIISMSFGVTDGDGDIKQAILEVRKERKDSVIFLASAGNSGPHEDIALPARYEGVTSIRATDCMGTVAGTNPTIDWLGAISFATFGDNIPARFRDFNPEVCKPGSSVSTAIAAGIAATMLSYACLLRLLFPNTISEDELKKLRTVKGVQDLFLTLSTDVGNRIWFINLVKFFADRKTNFLRLCAIVECIRKAT